MRTTLKKLFQVTWRERFLLLEALLLLGTMRFLIVFIPFPRIFRFLNLRGEQASLLQASTPLSGDQSTVAGRGTASSQVEDRVGWAVNAAAARTPWESSCLVRALAGFLMLRRRGIPGAIHLGVAKAENRDFIAHGWLSSGGRMLTGGENRAGYTEIAALVDNDHPERGGMPEK